MPKAAPYLSTPLLGLSRRSMLLSPKAEVETKMKEWPSGSHLVLEGKKDGVDLIFLGYKYNKKKVILFLSPRALAVLH